MKAQQLQTHTPTFFSVVRNKTMLFVLLLTCIIHASYIPNGFTWLDQNDIVERNAIVPIQQIPETFSAPFGKTSFYRPLVTILNSFDSFLYRDHAPGYHFTNLLLHLVATALVPLFLSAFFKFAPKPFFIAALVFGLHPASILVVGSITQRQELLLIICIMLTVYFHKKARDQNKISYKAATLLTCLLALFSKETALVIIPLLIAFWELLNKKKPDVKFFLSELLIIVIYIAMRTQAVASLWGTQAIDLTPSQHVGTRLGLFLKWILLLVSPTKPLFSDAVSILELYSPKAFGALCLIGAIFTVIIRSGFATIRSRSLIILLIFLAAGLNIVPVPRIGSPHYLYLPALGLTGVIVTFLSQSKSVLVKIALTIWLIIAGLSVFAAGFHFQNNYTLFKPEVEKDPYFYEGHYYLGHYYLRSGDSDVAEKEFEMGLVENPRVIAFRNKWAMRVNLAGISLEKGDLQKAEELYKKAEPETPDSMKVYMLYNRAIIAYQRKDYLQVVELLSDKELPTKESYMLLADALTKLNRHEEAEKILQHVTR